MNKNLIKQVQDFAKLWGGFRASRVLLTANHFAVFEHLRSPKTAAEVALVAGIDPRATEMLLDAVAALGLLKKSGAKYRNTPVAEQFLLKDSPWYQGDMLRHADSLWQSWSGLDDVVRTGLPNRSAARDNESFIKAMHNNAVFRAQDIITRIDLRRVKKALDLGGGPGTYARELSRRGISVTLFDLPDTIEIARAMINPCDMESPGSRRGRNAVSRGRSRSLREPPAPAGGGSTGTEGRNIDFKSGNFLSDDIGSGYDLVLISQIFHSLSADENRLLLKKSYHALNPKGCIAVQEFLLERNRVSPASGALFSINMLVNTASGRCYTPQEMKEWLRQSGFKRIKTKMLSDTVLVMGSKQ